MWLNLLDLFADTAAIYGPTFINCNSIQQNISDLSKASSKIILKILCHELIQTFRFKFDLI